jgi:DnaJ-domain-containing protein 1
MSIGRRFLNIARTELNSLLDFAAKHTDDDSAGGEGSARDSADDGTGSLHGFSAKELEEELERRRSARQEVEDAIHGRRSPDPAARPGPRAGSGPGGRAAGGGVTESLRVQEAYAALEVPAGADFETVRKAYRTLMRKYHPDHHTESPSKQRAANEVAQRLTEAYKLLEKKLRK